MATIDRPELAIGTDRLQDLATLSVSCEVHFTEFEVNAVNLLGLRYRLHCRLFNKDLWDVEPVAVFDDRMFTREAGATVSQDERVVFDTVRKMSDLHIHVFSKDELVAELRLENEETGEDVIGRTKVVAVDLT